MTKYSGAENLKIMNLAINYNDYLSSLIFKYAKNIHSPKILDIGAGYGYFAKRISYKFPKIVCIEPDISQAQIIRSKELEVKKALFGLKKESFDFIYTLNVLEHIKNDVSSVKNWVRYLKPGGLILIYVPAFQVLFSSMDKKVGHFRRYRKSELEAIANHLNLSIVELKYADSLGFLISLVYKFIGDKGGEISPGALKIYDKFIFPLSVKLDKFFNFVVGKNVYIVLKKELKSRSDY